MLPQRPQKAQNGDPAYLDYAMDSHHNGLPHNQFWAPASDMSSFPHAHERRKDTVSRVVPGNQQISDKGATSSIFSGFSGLADSDDCEDLLKHCTFSSVEEYGARHGAISAPFMTRDSLQYTESRHVDPFGRIGCISGPVTRSSGETDRDRDSQSSQGRNSIYCSDCGKGSLDCMCRSRLSFGSPLQGPLGSPPIPPTETGWTPSMIEKPDRLLSSSFAMWDRHHRDPYGTDGPTGMPGSGRVPIDERLLPSKQRYLESHSMSRDYSRSTFSAPTMLPQNFSNPALADVFDAGGVPSKYLQKWTTFLFSQIDNILVPLLPTVESLNERHRLYRHLREMMSTTLGIQILPIGSFVSGTFLPSSDINVSLFVVKPEDENWFVHAHEILCTASFEGNAATVVPAAPPRPATESPAQALGVAQQPPSGPGTAPPPPAAPAAPVPPRSTEYLYGKVSVDSITFLNTEAKLLRCSMNNVSVTITANQLGLMYAQAFIISLDEYVGRNHIFKKSIVLIKAWCKFESPRFSGGKGGVLTNMDGGLDSWAIVVMTVWIFNKEGFFINHPMQALGYFLQFYATFDWSKYAVTVHGPVSAFDLAPLSPIEQGMFRDGMFFPRELLDQYCARYHSTKGASIQSFKLGCSQTVQPKGSGSQQPGASGGSSGSGVGGGGGAGGAASGQEYQSSYADFPTPPYMSPLDMPYAEQPQNWGAAIAFSGGDVYQRGLVNVIDPIVPKNNVARGVDQLGLDILRSSLREGYQSFINLCEDCFEMHAQSGAQVTAREAATTADGGGITAGRNSSNRDSRSTASRSTASRSSTSSSKSVSSLSSSTPADRYMESYALLTEYGAMAREFLVNSSDLNFVNRGSLPRRPSNLRFASGYDVMISQPEEIEKGSMSIGELGKYLQKSTESDAMIRTLKEQYGGLKRAIEASGSPFLEVQMNHQFNPTINLCNIPPVAKYPITTPVLSFDDSSYLLPRLGSSAAQAAARAQKTSRK